MVDERGVLILINAFVLLLSLIIQLITPRASRKNILFGVKVPEYAMEDREVLNLKNRFTLFNLLIGIPPIIILSLLLYRFPNPILQIIITFGYLGLLFLIYLKFNFKAKALKKEKNWDKDSKKIVVVDIRYSRDKSKIGIISPLWYLIPLTLVAFNLILGIVLYPDLPDKIPTHWNFKGEITTYADKSYGTVLLLPFFQLLTLGILYFSHWSIGRTKQQIDPDNPEISLKKNIIFRKAWSIYLFILTILITLLFTALGLLSYGIFFKTIKAINIITWIIVGFSMIGAIILSIKLGQGGERLKLDGEEGLKKGYDKEDDHLWKLGNTIYYNPEDSSIFVEKRFGVGWTVNVGRPLGMFIMIMPFIITIITLIIAYKL